MYDEIEERLFTWLTEQTTCGNSLTDASIIEKVVELKETISSCCDFKISIDWLKDFKKRYGIHLKRIRTDQDGSAAKFFSIGEEEERRNSVFIKEEKIQEEYEAEKNDDHENDIEQEKIINQGNKNENTIKKEELIIRDQDENAMEQEGVVNQENQNENAINEIEYIFERLMYYSIRAPRHIYLMVEGLKLFFLNNRNQ